MLKHVGIYLPLPVFPLASSVWHFPDPCHLTSPLQLLKGIDNIQKTIETDDIKNVISRGTLKFQIHK